MTNKQAHPKLTLTALGRAKYSTACDALYYLDELYKVMEYYEQPKLEVIKIDLGKEKCISHVQFLQLMRFYHVYRNKLIGVIGEDRYNTLMQEEQELAAEKERLEQQASSEKEGSGSIIYE